MHRFNLFRSSFLLVAFVFVSQSPGCTKSNSSQIVGGPCTYSDFEGTATITKLTPQDDGYWAIFDTTLSKQPPPKNYRNEGHRVLIKNAGGKTDEKWLSAQGISVGVQLDFKVAIITSGTCTPVVFEFPTLPAGSVQD